MERHFPGGPVEDLSGAPEENTEYRRLHSERSAAIVGDWLAGEGAEDELVAGRPAADPRPRDRRGRGRGPRPGRRLALVPRGERAGRRPLVHERPVRPRARRRRSSAGCSSGSASRARGSSRSRCTRRPSRLSTEPEWLAPASLDEALALRAERGEERPSSPAGRSSASSSTSGCWRRRRFSACSALPDWTTSRADGELRLGAMTTHRAVELSPVVREGWPALAHAFAVVASPRVRNQATVGGVLADADYASDPPAMLVALGARAVPRSVRGEREVPVEELILGYYETSLEPDELLVEVVVPGGEHRAAYRKFRSRSHEDRPVRRRRGRAGGRASCASSSAPSPTRRSSSRSSATRQAPPAEIGARLRRGDRPDRRRPRLGRLPPARDRGRGAARARGASRDRRRASPARARYAVDVELAGHAARRGSCARRIAHARVLAVDAAAVPDGCVVLLPDDVASSARYGCQVEDQTVLASTARATPATSSPPSPRRHRARRRRRPRSSRSTTRSCRRSSTRSRPPRRARRSCTSEIARRLRRGGVLRDAPAAGDERLPPLPASPRRRRRRLRRGRRRRRGDVPDGRARSTRRWSRTRALAELGRRPAEVVDRARRRRSTCARTWPRVFGLASRARSASSPRRWAARSGPRRSCALEAIAAALARKAGRPVKLVLAARRGVRHAQPPPGDDRACGSARTRDGTLRRARSRLLRRHRRLRRLRPGRRAEDGLRRRRARTGSRTCGSTRAASTRTCRPNGAFRGYGAMQSAWASRARDGPARRAARARARSSCACATCCATATSSHRRGHARRPLRGVPAGRRRRRSADEATGAARACA